MEERQRSKGARRAESVISDVKTEMVVTSDPDAARPSDSGTSGRATPPDKEGKDIDASHADRQRGSSAGWKEIKAA